MKRDARQSILDDGEYALALVSLQPDKYLCVSGHYLSNDTFFGRLIRWWERGESSHSSNIFIDKNTLHPVLEVHALEGWGVIATRVGVLAHKNCTIELRRIVDAPDAKACLKILVPLIGADYEKPLGFITKSREDDESVWFCSELQDHLFNLQNCKSCLVSPPWARRSDKAREVIGEIRKGQFEQVNTVGGA
jgi:hypothetical protein